MHDMLKMFFAPSILVSLRNIPTKYNMAYIFCTDLLSKNSIPCRWLEAFGDPACYRMAVVVTDTDNEELTTVVVSTVESLSLNPSIPLESVLPDLPPSH